MFYGFVFGFCLLGLFSQLQNTGSSRKDCGVSFLGFAGDALEVFFLLSAVMILLK